MTGLPGLKWNSAQGKERFTMRVSSCRFLWVVLLMQGCGPTKVTQTHINGVLPPSITLSSADQMAGTFGCVMELATILTVPVLGDRNAGAMQMWLHQRTWNAQTGGFEESVRWCTMDVYEVEGNKLTIPVPTIHSHAPMRFPSTVDAALGLYNVAHLVDIWGMHNLPDPDNTPIPTRHDYQNLPQSDWVFDEDNDGNPAITGNTTGVAGGVVDLVVRGQYALRGSVVSTDRIQGLVTLQRFEQNTLKSNNPLAEGEGVVRQDADERLTWFDMIRMPDNATCDDVVAAQAEGRLATRRPF